MQSSPRQLADEPFVSLTTFRRSGEGVSTPVWVIADPDGDGVVVMTPHDSGKVKRVRRDPRVTLRPCGRFGGVDDDAPVVEGTARVGVYDQRLEQAFKDAYGAEYRVIMGVERLTGGGRKDRVALHIS
ncbi:PPOX class F420-dependent oxidoreductase [Solirubrobacter sp. CPCC 204708]|nr:PPOX class F420-dependent oxidoreductase [Solirubrobacter deserti]